MKTRSKTFCLLALATISLGACQQNAWMSKNNYIVEPVQNLENPEFSLHKPKNHEQSLSSLLTDFEYRLEQFCNGFAAQTNMPHRIVFHR